VNADIFCPGDPLHNSDLGVTEAQSERQEDAQTSVPRTNGASGALGGVGRTHCAVLPRRKTGRPPFSLQTMLRDHFMQQWFGLVWFGLVCRILPWKRLCMTSLCNANFLKKLSDTKVQSMTQHH
jgi:hypothetical protein